MNIVKRIGMLCLPCFLVACTTIPAPSAPSSAPAPVNESAEPYPDEAQPVVKPKVKPEPAPVDGSASAPAAVVALLERAQQQELQGDEQAAAASLERAIRIAPRYPESYLRLGELRYKQGSYNQARSLGQKALSLGAEWWLRRQAQSLVDRASKALQY